MGSFQQLLFGMGCLTCMAASAVAEAPRIAVVSSEGAADFSALVVTELSSDADIALVERDELAKAGDELSQQALARTDARALGRLVGADGLLFINKTPEGIQIRFTAVGLGYALFEDRLVSAANPVAQAKSVAHRVGSYVAKLRLKPDQAVPISVLNLRSELVTASSNSLERKLTLLLESQLASAPNCVVLERRHAWSVAFEHSLSTTSSTLLQGAYLVDGSLTFPAKDAKDIIVHLRLRSPAGQKTPLEIRGLTDDLPALVEKMSTAIQKVIGTSATASSWQPQTEAAEYLQEGIWARRNGQAKAALEALDSAELLGEKSPDLLAVRIPVLCNLGGDVSSLQNSNSSVDWMDRHWPFNRNTRMPRDPRPEERLEQVLRAMADLDRYKREDGERHLGSLKFIRNAHSMTVTQEGKTEILEKYVFYAASKVLLMLRQLQHPGTAELRQAIRTSAGYDPLHGKLPVGGVYALQYADAWSDSPEETFSYYEILCKDFMKEGAFAPEGPMYGTKEELDRLLLRDGPKEFCPLFARTPEERKKLFDQFTNQLIADPQTMPLGLLIGAKWADPVEQKAAYIRFLEALWQNREALTQSRELISLLRKAMPLQGRISKTAEPQLLALIHFYLQRENATLPNKLIWNPAMFPANEAPSLWKDLQDWKKRYAAKFGDSESARMKSGLDYFSELEKSYTDQFGLPVGAVVENQAPPRSLQVNRFWHGGLASGGGQMQLQDLFGARGADDVVWIYGYDETSRREQSLGVETPVRASIFKIHLPDLQTESIPLPWPVYPWKLRRTTNFHAAADGIYIVSNRDSNPQQSYIDRYSFASQQWEHHEIQMGIEWLYFIDEKIYMSFTGGIGRHDWEANRTIILANSRRRPAQNQLDDCGAYTVSSIFLSSENKVCVQVGLENYVIQETPGKWVSGPQIKIFQGMPKGAKSGIFSGMHRHNATQEPMFHPVSKEAAWFRPGHDMARSSGDIKGYGYRDSEIFILSQEVTPTLWWFKPGQPNPTPIPLDVKMDEKTYTLLKSLYSPATFNQIKLPPASEHQFLNMVVADQGLCLFAHYGGFWFIPFGDIDAYLKEARL